MVEEPRPLEAFSEENQIFVTALRSDDPEVVRDALAEMASVVDDDLVDELVRLAASPGDEELRGEILGTIAEELTLAAGEGPSADPLDILSISADATRRTTSALRVILDDPEQPKLVRRRALEASMQVPAPWHAEAVRQAWATGDLDWQVSAVFCMAFLPKQGFAPQVAEALASPSRRLRAEAVTAVADLELRIHGPTLARLATDRRQDPEVRSRAIEALADLDLGRYESLLMEIADGEGEIAELALETLDHARRMKAMEDDDFDGDDDFAEDDDDFGGEADLDDDFGGDDYGGDEDTGDDDFAAHAKRVH